MKGKALLASKTLWFAIAMTVAGILQLVAGEEWLTAWPEVAPILLTAAGLITAVIRQFTVEPLRTSKTVKLLLIALVGGSLLCCPLSADTWENGPAPKPTPVVKVDTTPTINAEDSDGVLGNSNRRKMGVTFRNILRKTRELKKEGALEGLKRPEISALVLSELVADNPKAFPNPNDPNLDPETWDRILAFISAILKIVLMFI